MDFGEDEEVEPLGAIHLRPSCPKGLLFLDGDHLVKEDCMMKTTMVRCSCHFDHFDVVIIGVDVVCCVKY